MSSHKITYRERGAGPVMVLLHGYGGSVHHWEPVAENLKSSFRVVVPNLSHVYMSTDKIFFTVQVEILADFIRTHFPNQKVCLAGLSYGGSLAWALSLQHPELIEKLILINPMILDPVSHFILPELRYFFALPMTQKMTYFLLATPIGQSFLKRAAQLFREERTHGAVRVENLKGRKLMFVAHMIHNFSWILRSTDWGYWRQKMKTASQVRALLIYDREDLLFAADSYSDFSQKFKCERIVEMTGSGHIAIKTRPEAVSRHILEFAALTVAA